MTTDERTRVLPRLPRLSRRLGILRGRADTRVRATWRILVPLALWISVFAALSAIVARVPGIDAVPREITGTAAYLGALGVTLAVSARLLDHRPVRAYGFDLDRRWWLDLAGGLAIGVVTQGLLKGTYLALGWARVSAVASPGTGTASFALGIALTLVLMVGVGVWEETLLRGVFITNAVEGLGSRVDSPAVAVLGAWLASSAVFGALHLDAAGGMEMAVPVYLLSTAMSGLYFGLAYVLTDSLAFPIGLHVATNFAAVSLFGRATPTGREFATLVRFEREFTGIWVALDGLNLLYATSLLLAVVAWVSVTRGSVSVSDSLLEAASGDDRR